MNTILGWLAFISFLVAVGASMLSMYYLHKAIETMADWNERVELKPCPFCGGEPDGWHWRYAIVCPKCGYGMYL